MIERVASYTKSRRASGMQRPAARHRSARIHRAVMAAATLLVLTACGTAQPVPSEHFYRLDITPPKALPKPKLEGVVEVRRFEADNVTADRSIVYTTSAHRLELKSYNYHLWAESPTVMLRDGLIGALRAAGAAGEVAAPKDRVNPDYVITGEIKRMEQVVGTQPARAVLQIELALRKAQGGKLLMLKDYRVERDVEGDGINAFAVAMNNAASELFARFVADLARL